MGKQATIEIAVDLELLTCSQAGCGISFAVPAWWVQERRKDHTTWYCPNGHNRYFPGQSDEEKLKKELAAAEGNAKYYKERLASEKGYSASLERSRSALRGVATRLRAKGKVGECAFCNRHFADLAAHVAEQHADVDPEKVDEAEVPE